MNKEIKNCPCCGAEAVIEVFEARKGWEASICCTNCLLQMISITYDTKEEAEKKTLEAWNRRSHNGE